MTINPFYHWKIMMTIIKKMHVLSLSLLFFSLPVMASAEAEVEAEVEAEETHNADDVAKELANPNTTLASIVFKNQFTLFTGDLP
ncbi:MAG: hypothetical protein JRJ37_04455, partial [Deltaproteobacteria bacterium]|nr:hypothetical protein [Deltaproteobacteria bacterium]